MSFDRRPLPYAWDDVKARLQRDLLRLCARLGLRFQADRSGILTPLNPTRRDRKPGSFVIWTQGPVAGGWKEYATGEGGDVFQLIAYLEGIDRADTMSQYWWALDYLGLGKGDVRTVEQAQQDRERADRDRKAAEARDIGMEDSKSEGLFKRWLELKPIDGTLGEIYLRDARRIDVSRLLRLPRALRFDPACDHIDKTTGEVTTWPTIVSAMSRASKTAGLHRTYLAADGLGKAPVENAKKMLGPVRGAAIRLTRGEGDLSPADRIKKHRFTPLMIGEGIETTLTCATAQPTYASWAAGSLSLMGLLDWPEWASAVILLKDNDWKPEALAAFGRVEAHWQKQARGRVLKVVGSAVGSDFNDWVKR